VKFRSGDRLSTMIMLKEFVQFDRGEFSSISQTSVSKRFIMTSFRLMS